MRPTRDGPGGEKVPSKFSLSRGNGRGSGGRCRSASSLALCIFTRTSDWRALKLRCAIIILLSSFVDHGLTITISHSNRLIVMYFNIN